MSTLRVATLKNQAGVEVYTAKAWVNFNGTGTVAIRASGNVSSITDNGTGNYTVNFTTAMVDANYAVSTGGNRSPTVDNSQQGPGARAVSTTSFNMTTGSDTTTAADWDHIYAAIFR